MAPTRINCSVVKSLFISSLLLAGCTERPTGTPELQATDSSASPRPIADPANAKISSGSASSDKNPIQFGIKIWDGFTTIESYTFGHQLTTTLPEEPIGPTWKMSESTPPLSVSQAVALAEEFRQRTVQDLEDFEWGLSSITLVPWDAESGYWYWMIYFEQLVLQGGSTGVPSHLNVIVLMDGTVVHPTVTAGRKRNGF